MATSVNFRFEGGKCYADITRDTVESVDVQIYGYTKRISGTENSIDITPYLLEQFDQNYVHGFFNNGIVSNSKAAIIPQIRIDGVSLANSRANTIFVDGASAYEGGELKKGLASDLPYYRIISGQRIPIVISGIDSGEQVPSDIAPRTNTDSVTSMVGFAFTLNSMLEEATIHYGGYTVKFKIVPPALNNIRLTWLNRYGVFDYWNFQFTRDITTAASFDSIYTKNGYDKINVKADKHYAIETRELDKATLDALSYIFESKAVYIEKMTDNNIAEYEPIHIISDQCRIYSDSELSTLQLEFCPKVRI